MKVTEMVKEAVESGITPIRLTYEAVRFFRQPNLVLRSALVIESLDVGVLTFEEYRVVARRTLRGSELTARHLDKLLSLWLEILPFAPHLECFTLPAYASSLFDGSLLALTKEALSRYPNVTPEAICYEFSADLLYEDTERVVAAIEELRALGVRTAIFEMGDEFCPLYRVLPIRFDFAFVDRFTTDHLKDANTAPVAWNLVEFLHLLGTFACAPGLASTQEIDFAHDARFDGYTTTEDLLYYEVEEVPEDANE